MKYPTARRDNLVENIHGHQIADPYRWLEDPDSAETQAWVDSQNQITQSYLTQLPQHAWFTQELKQIMMQPWTGMPRRSGPWWLIPRRDGVDAQERWYLAKTLAELLAGGRMFLDPNLWSKDGTASLGEIAASSDGAFIAYTVSKSGSDWHTIVVIDSETGETIDESVVTKFSSPVWLPDSRSFLYAQYRDMGTADGTQTMALSPANLAVHRLGQDLKDDEILWENPGDPMLFTWGEVSHDESWLVVEQSWGTEPDNSLWVHPLVTTESPQGKRTSWGSAISIIAERTNSFIPVRIDGATLIMYTDHDAPNGRVVATQVDSDHDLTELVAQSDPITQVRAVGDGFVVEYMVDVLPRFVCYDGDGTSPRELSVTGTATLGVYSQAAHDELIFYLSSPTCRALATQASFATGEAKPLDIGNKTVAELSIMMDRRHALSADGTKVPYWLIAAADTDLSQPCPTIVYGYGGFDIAVQPAFSAAWQAWIKAGGAVVIATLRGGGEYGRTWYDAGRGKNKQRVFDDVIAVGEHLCSTGVSTPAKLAIHGRSNGGLLAGAALVQRPDLWAVALPGVGVLDMLRFHRFTGGLAWASDYGNPDNLDDFEVALAYSPLHNICEGKQYPATLVTTGDHDDRVVPLHSHKFTATLQHAQGGSAPILTRIETATGHGAGKPLHMVAQEWADILTFAAYHTALVPRQD
ncbi:MAG: prolyl oligopeptidase family serine peptidase [Propionibacteriaceae bacterium]